MERQVKIRNGIVYNRYIYFFFPFTVLMIANEYLHFQFFFIIITKQSHNTLRLFGAKI